jgi:hypothetical protein
MKPKYTYDLSPLLVFKIEERSLEGTHRGLNVYETVLCEVNGETKDCKHRLSTFVRYQM